jgi:hypothetical protein
LIQSIKKLKNNVGARVARTFLKFSQLIQKFTALGIVLRWLIVQAEFILSKQKRKLPTPLSVKDIRIEKKSRHDFRFARILCVRKNLYGDIGGLRVIRLSIVVGYV